MGASTAVRNRLDVVEVYDHFCCSSSLDTFTILCTTVSLPTSSSLVTVIVVLVSFGGGTDLRVSVEYTCASVLDEPEGCVLVMLGEDKMAVHSSE